MLALAIVASTGGIAGAELRSAAALACCSSSCPAPARSTRDAERCCSVAPLAPAAGPAVTVVPRPIVNPYAALTCFSIFAPARAPVAAMITRGASPPGRSPSPAVLCSFQI